jgi:hypothetical protein
MRSLPPSPLRLAVLTFAGALVVAACAGSTPAATSTPAAATAAPTAPPTTAPTTAATTAATTAPSAASLPPAPTPAGSQTATSAPTTGPTSGGTIDVGGAAANLSGVKSYKLVVTTEGGPASGTATFVTVREPVLARSFESSLGGAKTRVVIIGQDVWVDGGSGLWVKNAIPLVVAEGMMSAFDPAVLFLGIGAWANTGGLQQVGTEDKNGVRAVHYHLDKTTVPAGTSIADNATIDLWVAEEGGYLVSVRSVGISNPGGPDSITMDISNINDPSLSVVAPT